MAKLSGGEPFSAAQGITALSILGVMMSPLASLLGSIPHSFSAIGCFMRIQEFLLLDERIESRDFHSKAHQQFPSLPRPPLELARNEIELEDLTTKVLDVPHISIVDGSFNWGEKSVLNEVTTSFPRHKNGFLTMVVGPIGSGKSSLLKAILGETVSAKGVISMDSPDIAFCDQTPWVMNASIRANIIAESKGFDESWYDNVVKACDLSIDFARFPEGDLTEVGDKGVKLSGGQKQRLVS